MERSTAMAKDGPHSGGHHITIEMIIYIKDCVSPTQRKGAAKGILVSE